MVHTIEGQVAYIKFDTLYNDYIDIRSNNYKFLKKEKKIGSTKNYICGYVVNNKDEFYRLMIYLNKKGYRKFCWKTKLNDFSENIFNEYAQNYRTTDEAWFCLTHDCEPPKCYCGKLAEFKNNEYKKTCETCSANADPEKIKHFKETISKRSVDDKRKTFEKRKTTIKEKYGDSNYTLFGSKSFKDNLLNKYGDEHYHNVEKAKQTFNLNLEKNLKIYSEAQEPNSKQSQKNKYFFHASR